MPLHVHNMRINLINMRTTQRHLLCRYMVSWKTIFVVPGHS